MSWRAHIFHRLAQPRSEATSDPVLSALLRNCATTLPPKADDPDAGGAARWSQNAIAVPLKLRTPAGVLSFISTTTVFGTPVDITLSELALETFFPADRVTFRGHFAG